MHKKVLAFLFLSMPVLAMQKTNADQQNHESTYLVAAVIDGVIGHPIPWTIYEKTLFSADHRFQIGELVALPSSHEWGTKNDPRGIYARIEAIDNDEITVLLKHKPENIIKNLKTKRPQTIGKFAEEIVQEALNNK